ncbi:MAG: HEAT repeat domain-containing protein [Deltaproteobacteria bacterium]|nr:HEAT repeat domain-containing protein [Deltaproteobacteria bacterium]
MDTAGAGMLIRLLSEDPAWTVRATAAEAAGKMGPARAEVGPALVACLGKEKEVTVLRRVLQAIGEIHYEEGIPDLMKAIDSPSLTLSEAAMYSLYRLTGEKLLRKEEWQEWYRVKYPPWKSRPKR